MTSQPSPRRLWGWLLFFWLIAGCQASEIAPTATGVPLSTATASTHPTQPPPIGPGHTPTPPASATPAPPISPTTLPSTAWPTLAPGATQISAQDGMILHFVPAGEFWMGSRETDPGADVDEMPAHRVYLDAFWMDETPVTGAMYARFLNEVGRLETGREPWGSAASEGFPLFWDGAAWLPLPGREDLPMVAVTWYGAQAYCAWAGRRLPTEAEWEKAARGDDERLYPWGNETDCSKAQVANCGSGLAPIHAHPGGGSPFGVLGLSGNVWEWVHDWYAPDYYAQAEPQNPAGPAAGITRVLRGGSYDYDWKHIRAANRRHNGPAAAMLDYGFRCVFWPGSE